MTDTSTPNRLRRTVTMPISCPPEVPKFPKCILWQEFLGCYMLILALHFLILNLQGKVYISGHPTYFCLLGVIGKLAPTKC